LRERKTISYAENENSDFEEEEVTVSTLTTRRAGTRRRGTRSRSNDSDSNKRSMRSRKRVDYKGMDEGEDFELEDGNVPETTVLDDDDEEFVEAEEPKTTKRRGKRAASQAFIEEEGEQQHAVPPKKAKRFANGISFTAGTENVPEVVSSVDSENQTEVQINRITHASINDQRHPPQNGNIAPTEQFVPDQSLQTEQQQQPEQPETTTSELSKNIPATDQQQPQTSSTTTTTDQDQQPSSPKTSQEQQPPPPKTSEPTVGRRKKKDSDEEYEPNEDQPDDEENEEADSEDTVSRPSRFTRRRRRINQRQTRSTANSETDDFNVEHSDEDEEDKFVRKQRATRRTRRRTRRYSNDSSDSDEGEAPLRERLRPRKEKQVNPYTHQIATTANIRAVETTSTTTTSTAVVERSRRYEELQARYTKSVAPTSPVAQPVRIHVSDSSSSDSSDDEMPANNKPEQLSLSGKKSMSKSSKYSHIAPINLPELAAHKKGKKPSADIDPMKTVNIGWDSIGGLQHHVDALKEMVVLPLLYPEVFQKFDITPPRGVIFFGPPGTGKTLVARALASTCSNGARPIAFFMRKGADILSKWVGEAEKQLRLLFDEAKKLQPSIIFFDEIDGLAPVRSSRQDYIHSSIVSTLLALMDGLDNRGQVVVIGATNRIDSIDPALRRPGRFDRELIFTLPSKSARKEIFNIHTKNWSPAVPENLADDIAKRAVGYCGADIKALCAESALCALRRKYPQIYMSSDRLLIDMDSVQVQKLDFLEAMKAITPASHRSAVVHARPLPNHLSPLLSEKMELLRELIEQIFPISVKHFAKSEDIKKIPQNGSGSSQQMTDDEEIEGSLDTNWTSFSDITFLDPNMSDYMINPPAFRPWLLLHGDEGMGQLYIGRAILYALEELSLFSLDFASLITNPSVRSAEEALISAFAEARKNSPSILWIPNVDEWWEKASEVLQSTLCSMLQDIPSSLNVMVIATANKCKTLEHLPQQLQTLFNEHHFQVKPPSFEQRKEMFSVFIKDVVRKPLVKRKKAANQLPELPKAPLPPVEVRHEQLLSEEEEKELIREEEHYLRELRIRLRDPMLRVITTKRYDLFAKPPKESGNQSTSSDHGRSDNLIYLYDMLENLEEGKYTSLKKFNHDIKKIVADSLLYQPGIDETSNRRNVSKAKQLYETLKSMYTIIPKELIKRCNRISKRRDAVEKVKRDKERAARVLAEAQNGSASGTTSGTAADPMQIDETSTDPTTVAQDTLEPVSNPSQIAETTTTTTTDPSTFTSNSSPTTPTTTTTTPPEEENVPDVQIDTDGLQVWYDRFLNETEGSSIDELDKHFSSVYKLLYKYRFEAIRYQLLDELRVYLEVIQRLENK
jgi:SpoVK/Ycf46/Vps4 family AAA+-type ATPase